jgi:hypothetical protein
MDEPLLETFLFTITALYPQGYIDKIRPPVTGAKLASKSLTDRCSTELFEMGKVRKIKL